LALSAAKTRLSGGVADMSKNRFLILFLARVWTVPYFAPQRNTFGCLESLLEVARGVGKLSHSSLGLLLHSWWVFPLFGVGEEDGL